MRIGEKLPSTTAIVPPGDMGEPAMTRIKPLIAAALALGGIAAGSAEAQRYGGGGYGYGYEQPYRGGYAGGGYRGDYGRYDHGGYRGGYRAYGYRDGRYGYDQPRGYRRCSNGTTGTVIGALAGGLLGRSIDDRGDRALGTILGAGAGALAGHAVEKSGNPGYCR